MRQFAKLAALQILRAYKWAISPMLPPSCRFVPTCSEYAMEAVDRYGVVRGGLMALWRLLRCHPLAHGGYDPVARAAAAPNCEVTRRSAHHIAWKRLQHCVEAGRHMGWNTWQHCAEKACHMEWKSGASAPRQTAHLTGFSPGGRLFRHLKRNA